MSYRSILVNIDIDGPIGPVLDMAIDLAVRCEAHLVGFSAAEARLPIAGAEGSMIAAEVWEHEKENIEHRLEELAAEFGRLAAGKVEAEWRGMSGEPTRSLAHMARLADIIVTTAPNGASSGNAFRVVDPGSLALQAGRPVLIASGAAHLVGKTVVVAWKDTREARRAAADAVPLLQLSEDVTVVTVDRDPNEAVRSSVADVAAYLRRHGINARAEVLEARDESARLREFVTERRADLVVSGAYGHSRLREWAFGGVTRSLLNEVSLNRFMAS